MKVLIELDDDMFKDIKESNFDSARAIVRNFQATITDAIRNGTTERKVGKWIRKPIRNDKGGCIGAEMICSCCNKDNRHDEYMDCCPNCGAEMRGANNE